MSTPRLTFLYPRFIRPFLISDTGAGCRPGAHCPSRSARRHQQRQCRRAESTAAFGASASRRSPGPMQRYGTANEPVPSPAAANNAGGSGGTGNGDTKAPKEGGSGTAKANAPTDNAGSKAAEEKSNTAQKDGAAANGKEDAPAEGEEQPPHPDGPPKASPTIFETTEGNEPPTPARRVEDGDGERRESNPLEAVLRMPAPSNRPVHLTTPRYVHHFDTWSLVKQLAESGFSEAQSVTAMKAIRGMLTDNIELARAGLVGKSDVENETYLFRAACSELRTEVGNNRKAENERMSTQRNQLQHEVDILGQKLGQDTSHLKEEVKGMFDDRKMAVRMEQKTMESKIQELNYKITVALNSDARSEVEGLRWIITRRAVTALVIVAVSILATLRFSSYMTHTQAQERKNMPKASSPSSSTSQPSQSSQQESGGNNGGGSGNGNGGGGADAGMGGNGSWSAEKALSDEGGMGDGVMISEGGVSLG